MMRIVGETEWWFEISIATHHSTQMALSAKGFDEGGRLSLEKYFS